MTDREKVIRGLEMSYTYSNVEGSNTLVPQQLVLDALALLKAQEPRVMAGAELTDAELIEKIRKAPIVMRPNVDAVPVVRCRDCKHFEVKDVWANFGSVPILVSDVPTCHRWEGECKTSPDGFCFLGERRDSE